MKTKYWLMMFAAVLVVCAALSAVLFLGGAAATAEIWLDGEKIRTVDLRRDQTFTVTSDWGSNTICVEDGTIRVTEASCPDHICMERGACKSGMPIVCLPNRLVIRFPDTDGTDIGTG